ncbi:MAG: hypothetical protein HZB09_02765 [Candidatus Yonathbacteria bacterium]|nr:hypothetical protein [Candidatus Yonathbacteria bacterium]
MAGETKTEIKSAHTSQGKTGDISRMTIRPLKTYRGDAEEAIQRQKESITSIALREQKKRAIEKSSETPPRISPEKQKQILIIAGITIGVLAIGGGIFALVRSGNFSFATKKPGETVIVKNNPTTPSLISPRYEREIDVTTNASKNTLASAVAEETGKDQEAGSITNIFLTQTRSQALQTVGIGKDIIFAGVFLNKFFPDAPDELQRSLDNNFMLGVYYDTAKKGHAFLVFKTNSFETSFAGMLSWEKTLLQDLGLIIGSKEGTGGFKDLVIRNKDTRALLERGREPVLLYSFVDRNTILVAPDKETFGNILDILNQPKRVTQ